MANTDFVMLDGKVHDPQRIDYVDTRYLVACSGCGIALLPHMTIRNSSTGQNPVYGTIKGDTLYRYVIVARKKGRNLSPSAEIVWRYMISASAKNR
jgi:DNA-binding transcriptional LysR family regulator